MLKSGIAIITATHLPTTSGVRSTSMAPHLLRRATCRWPSYKGRFSTPPSSPGGGKRRSFQQSWKSISSWSLTTWPEQRQVPFDQSPTTSSSQKSNLASAKSLLGCRQEGGGQDGHGMGGRKEQSGRTYPAWRMERCVSWQEEDPAPPTWRGGSGRIYVPGPQREDGRGGGSTWERRRRSWVPSCTLLTMQWRSSRAGEKAANNTPFSRT